jgi:hypothetical protein
LVRKITNKTMSGYPPYTQSALESVLLILSHFALVPSFIYFWLFKQFPEATIVAVLFVSSNFYHFCQAGYFCWVDSFETLQKADHFIVYLVVFWLMMWFIDLSLETRICIFFIVQYFLFPLSLFYIHASWLGIAFVVFLVVLFIVLTGVMPNKFPEVHFSSLIVLAILLVVGVIFFLIGGEPGETEYPWTHTLWHVCVMFGIFFLADARFGNSFIARKMYSILGTTDTLSKDLGSYSLVDPEDPSDDEGYSSDDSDEPRNKPPKKKTLRLKVVTKSTKESKKVSVKLKDDDESQSRKHIPILVSDYPSDRINPQNKVLFIDTGSKRK